MTRYIWNNEREPRTHWGRLVQKNLVRVSILSDECINTICLGLKAAAFKTSRETKRAPPVSLHWCRRKKRKNTHCILQSLCSDVFSFQHQGQRARASFESALRTTDSYTKHESVAQAERTQWTAVYLALATQANEVTFLHLKHFLCVEAFLVIHHNIPRIKVEVLHLSIYFYSCYATCTFVFCFSALRTVNHPSVNVLNLCIFFTLMRHMAVFVMWRSSVS